MRVVRFDWGATDNLFGPCFFCMELGIDHDGAGICIISPIDRGAIVIDTYLSIRSVLSHMISGM